MISPEQRKSHLAMWNGAYGAERGPSAYQRRDDGSHIFANQPEYYEWWYFDASFSNDYHVVITFHYRNGFLKPMIPTLQIHVYLPDGRKLERLLPIRPEEASANPDYCDVCMGDSRVREENGVYDLQIMIKGVGARLRFQPLTQPWKPGTGFNYHDAAAGLSAGWVVPLPHAEVSGELYIKGETIAASGNGYHDHNWGNYYCYRTFSSWYWGRVHNRRYALDYAWVRPRLEGAPVLAPLLIARDGEILLSTNMLEARLEDLRVEPEFKREYAGRLELSVVAAGVELEMAVTVKRVIEAVKMPPAADWDQHYYRFLADYRLRLKVEGQADDEASGELLQELILL